MSSQVFLSCYVFFFVFQPTGFINEDTIKVFLNLFKIRHFQKTVNFSSSLLSFFIRKLWALHLFIFFQEPNKDASKSQQLHLPFNVEVRQNHCLKTSSTKVQQITKDQFLKQFRRSSVYNNDFLSSQLWSRTWRLFGHFIKRGSFPFTKWSVSNFVEMFWVLLCDERIQKITLLCSYSQKQNSFHVFDFSSGH